MGVIATMIWPLVAEGQPAAVPSSSSQQTASQPTEEVSIHYEAATCGDQAAFLRRVRVRTSKFNLVPKRPGVRHFEIVLSESESLLSARLSISDDTGPAQSREVENGTCAELVDAMALMTALAIDPSAPALPLEESPSSEPETEPLVTAPLKAETAVKQEEKPEEPRPKEPGPAPQERASAWRMSAGLHGVLTLGVTRPPLFGGALDVGIGRQDKSWFNPEVRVLGLFQGSPVAENSAGGAKFRLIGAGLEACPAKWGFGTVDVRPCAQGTLASLRGKGVSVENARSESKPFASLGLGLRGALHLHQRLTLDARLGGQFPLRRDRFLVAEEEISRSSVLTGQATLGLSLWL